MGKTIEEAFEQMIDKRKIEQRKAIEAAFGEWFRRVDAYNSMPTIEDAFAAGAAHGAAEERKAMLEIFRSVRYSELTGIDALNAAERRIRQRGEK